MSVLFWQAQERVEEVAAQLFAIDPSLRSVGVSRQGGGYGYRAVRNSAVPVPFEAAEEEGGEILGFPVTFVDTPAEVESMVAVTVSGPASPATSSLVAEVHRHRPLVCGLQIQNFDDDDRQGVFGQGVMNVGTLGCFVRTPGGLPALLSNNHVLAGQNRGLRAVDRILQPGSDFFNPADHVAVLVDFVDLVSAAPGSTPATGAFLNEVDAGVAELLDPLSFRQGYLAVHTGLTSPLRTASALIGDQVFKVGRTTGLTLGEVVDIAAVVGPVPYDVGLCWFRRSLVIEGVAGSQFSDKGDSGAAIVRTNGEVVGILYAGNGSQTYACPIEAALTALSCALV
jgi:hypothetical protein